MSGNSADGRTWEARVVQHRSVKRLWLGSLRVSSYSCTKGQAAEALLACNVLNRMTDLGRPESYGIGG